MTGAIPFTDITFACGSPEDQASGLLGYVTFTLGPLRVDGVTVRRVAGSRRLVLSFPSRRDSRGRQHPIVRPLGDRERREVELEIFRALGLGEPATRSTQE